MNMATIDTVRQYVEPLLAEKDIELIKVDFLKTKGKYRLIFTVDKYEGTISLDELAQVSNLAGALIEEKSLIDEAYDLEVTSPGVERPLVKERDYERFAGKVAKLVLVEKVDDQFVFQGTIKGIKEDKVFLEINENILEIEFNNIKRAHLVYDIREDLK
jgi:ribosome maturation factor RimP